MVALVSGVLLRPELLGCGGELRALLSGSAWRGPTFRSEDDSDRTERATELKLPRLSPNGLETRTDGNIECRRMLVLLCGARAHRMLLLHPQ